VIVPRLFIIGAPPFSPTVPGGNAFQQPCQARRITIGRSRHFIISRMKEKKAQQEPSNADARSDTYEWREAQDNASCIGNDSTTRGKFPRKLGKLTAPVS
jgi:hypothetical protein